MTRLRIWALGLFILVCLGIAALFQAGLRLSPDFLYRFDPEPALAAAENYEAEIIRDAYGVAHVTGKRDADAAFALAYAHAQDDFATIQQSLYGARGRAALARTRAEAVQSYLVQLFDVRRTVEERFEPDLSPKLRAMLKGYADGLNYYAALHPQEIDRNLFPVEAQDLARLSYFGTPLFYGMSRTLSTLLNPQGERRVSAGQELQVSLLERADRPELGSNGFAVAPARSDDGATRLFVNSHQPVSGPLAWYEVRMTSQDGLNFAGGTFPGSALPFVGHNEHLGWTATTNRPDVIDVFELTVNPDNDGQYRLDGEWVDFEREEAVVTLHLWGPLAWRARREIIRSRHGPALRTERGTFALRYATMDDLRFMEQQYRLVKATSFTEFLAALRMTAQANQNRIYADREGNIAMFYVAKIPKRVSGLDYSGILPGDRSDLIWTEFVDFNRLPHVINPPEGFVTEANATPFHTTGGPSDPKPEDYPAEFGIETRLTNRARRAVALFKSNPAISREDLIRYKFDKSYHPQSLAGTLRQEILTLEFPDEARLREAQDLLRDWDLTLDAGNRAGPLAILTMQPIGVAHFFGRKPPETETAFRKAVEILMTHYGRLDVPWSAVNRLVRGTVSLPIAGGPDTLRAVNSELQPDGTLKMVSGDGLVMLIEWGTDGNVQSHSVHHFGAAMSRPSSPHYADQTALFAAERLKSVPFHPEDVARATARRYRPGEEKSWQR